MLHTSVNSDTQIFFNLPCLSLFLDLHRKFLPLLLLLLLLVVFGMGTVCCFFGQYICIRRTQELSHICWQREVCEEGHGMGAGYFSKELQELLIQSGQADQDTTGNHPDGTQRQVD